MTNPKLKSLAQLNETPAQRIRNEQLYLDNNRRISSTIQALLEQADTAEFPVGFGCECANAQCLGEISMTPDQFESLHQAEREFMILPGHEELDIEVIVEKADGYYRVRKHNLAVAGAF